MIQVHGGDIYNHPNMIDFSANINPLGMPEAVRNAAQLGIDAAIHYPEVLSSRLRNALAEHHKVYSKNVIVGNGAAELIFSLCFAKRPKKALLIAPSFAEYEAALSSISCEIIYYYLMEEKEFQMEEDIFSYLTEDIDLIFLCNPNNPTGTCLEKACLQKMLLICEKKDILMVVDECFIDFLENAEEISMRSLVGTSKHLFLLNAFTKLYAMPGLRLGYGLSCNRQLLEKMLQCMQPWNVSVPAQYAGLAALKEKQYVLDTRRYLEKEKRYLMEHLSDGLVKKLYGFSANYIFFQAAENLAERLKREGILIRDCSNFTGLNKGYFRIAVRTRKDNEALIQAMKKVKVETQSKTDM